MEKFKTVDDLAKSYLEAEKGLGSRLKVPEKDDDEGWGEVYGKLGRPEKPEDYSFEGIEHEALLTQEGNAATVERFREIAHNRGLNNRQASSIINDVLAMTVEQQAARSADGEKNIAELKQEFGAAYDSRVGLANDTLKMLTEKSGADWGRLGQALEESGMSSQPDLVRALSQMGRMMQQDKLWGSGGEPRSMAGMSRTEIQGKIAKLEADNMYDLQNGTEKGAAVQNEIFSLLDQLGRAE